MIIPGRELGGGQTRGAFQVSTMASLTSLPWSPSGSSALQKAQCVAAWACSHQSASGHTEAVSPGGREPDIPLAVRALGDPRPHCSQHMLGAIFTACS